MIASQTLALALVSGAFAQTDEAPMMRGLQGYFTTPLLTVGETVPDIDLGDDYRFTGIPDGIGAFAIDDDTIRIFLNHEFSDTRGAPFQLANGATFPSGGRISIFDLDKSTLQITRGGLGIQRVFMDGGIEITPDNIDDYIDRFEIIDRPCSANLATPSDGLADTIFFTGEEQDGGRAWALDTATRTLYELPALGNGAWENALVIPTSGALKNKTLIVLPDDTAGRPAYLYVGDKTGAGFLERNGLVDGQLYTLVLDSGANTNLEFNGTGNTEPGAFVPLASNDPSSDLNGDGIIDRDDDIQNMDNLVEEAGLAGAFFFSRPEDIAANPQLRGERFQQVVFASTGRVTNLGDLDGDGVNDVINDPWGTTYIFTIDTQDIEIGNDRVGVEMTIAFDANESGHRDFAIRSPDNLDWTGDGFIYIQEDAATSAFGRTSGIEASIWRLDPSNADTTRVGVMDRSAVPDGQVDTDPDDLGDWESSGILDISELLGEPAASTLIFTVQAHGVQGGVIDEFDLEQGGQLLLLHSGCLGDWDRDGDIDAEDFLAFLDSFGLGEPRADLDLDGDIDAEDFFAYLDAFVEGCG